MGGGHTENRDRTYLWDHTTEVALRGNSSVYVRERDTHIEIKTKRHISMRPYDGSCVAGKGQCVGEGGRGGVGAQRTETKKIPVGPYDGSCVAEKWQTCPEIWTNSVFSSLVPPIARCRVRQSLNVVRVRKREREREREKERDSSFPL